MYCETLEKSSSRPVLDPDCHLKEYVCMTPVSLSLIVFFFLYVCMYVIRYCLRLCYGRVVETSFVDLDLFARSFQSSEELARDIGNQGEGGS